MIRVLFGAVLGGVAVIAIIVVMVIALVTNCRVILPACPATPQSAMICAYSTPTMTAESGSANAVLRPESTHLR